MFEIWYDADIHTNEASWHKMTRDVTGMIPWLAHTLDTKNTFAASKNENDTTNQFL